MVFFVCCVDSCFACVSKFVFIVDDHRRVGHRNDWMVMSLEDWADVRALHHRNGLSRREFARRLGDFAGDGESDLGIESAAEVLAASGGDAFHAGGAAGAGVTACDAIDTGEGNRGADHLVGVADESAPARAQDAPGLSFGGSSGSAGLRTGGSGAL